MGAFFEGIFRANEKKRLSAQTVAAFAAASQTPVNYSASNVGPPESTDRNQLPPKLDAKILRALCFLKRRLSENELEMLFNARAEWNELDQAFPLAEEFVKIIRGQSSMPIGLWIVKAYDSGIKELRSFANGLQKDFLAVREATTSPWSNGQTEGQVNRLKLLKRQMYGRANFDLLKGQTGGNERYDLTRNC